MVRNRDRSFINTVVVVRRVNYEFLIFLTTFEFTTTTPALSILNFYHLYTYLYGKRKRARAHFDSDVRQACGSA